MFRLVRPNAASFRWMLALALLAWTALAFGAPSVTEADHAQARQSQAQITNGATHCHGAMMASARAHDMSAPMASMDHGDCCQTACRCPAPSTAVMMVPWVLVAFIPSGGDWSAGPKPPVPPVPTTQPLRPPIA